MTSQEDDLIDHKVRTAVGRARARDAHGRAERARGWFDALVALAVGVGVAAGLDLVVEAAALRACS